MHINCLDLLAAFLAVKCFARNKTHLTIHLKMDISPDIHQQTRGNDLPTVEQPGQRAMAMVLGEEHPPQSPAPGRCVEHRSRRRIPTHEEG